MLWFPQLSKLVRFLVHQLFGPPKLALVPRTCALCASTLRTGPPGYGAKPSWHPPASPFHLVEERLYSDPWRLLVACIFLNKTTAKVAVPVMDKYFSKWGSPEAASAADELELAQLLQPMGLHKKRAQMLIRFSREYLGPWTSPARDLHGIGKYGEDAWRLFCCGDLEVQPTDKELLRYLSWYRCALRTVG